MSEIFRQVWINQTKSERSETLLDRFLFFNLQIQPGIYEKHLVNPAAKHGETCVLFGFCDIWVAAVLALNLASVGIFMCPAIGKLSLLSSSSHPQELFLATTDWVYTISILNQAEPKLVEK